MGEAEVREILKSYWQSPLWATAIDNATDSQVVAIFMRLKLEGKINKEKK